MNMLNIPELHRAVKGIEICVDTREHDNAALKWRLEQMKCPTYRAALNVGDYAARFPLPGGGWYDLADRCVVERKQSIDEISGNLGRNRERFIREFDRAKEKGTRIYLLIENSSFGQIYRHEYGSRMNEESIIGSLLALLARYDCRLIMCDAAKSGQLIKKILAREGYERMKKELVEV